jgi:hypothetical protein
MQRSIQMAESRIRVSRMPQHEPTPTSPRGWRAGVEAHLERHLGPCQGLYQAPLFDNQRFAIAIYGPTGSQPYHTLVTLGLSDSPRPVPDGWEAYRHLELMCCLPLDWRLPTFAAAHVQWRQQRWAWPLRELWRTVRQLYREEAWLGPGHSVQNGDPPRPYAAGTVLACGLYVPPVEMPPTFGRSRIAGRELTILHMLPLTAAESRWKLAYGACTVLRGLAAGGSLSPVIAADRACTAPSPIAADPEPGPDPDPPEPDPFYIAQPFDQIIDDTRRDYLQQRRHLGFFARRRLRLRPPAWVQRPGCPLGEIYARQRSLIEHGRVVWGRIVQADRRLYHSANQDPYPALAIPCPNEAHPATPALLDRIAARLVAAKLGRLDHPSALNLAELLVEDHARRLRLPLPPSLGEDHQVFGTTVMVHPQQLPVPFLVDGLVPLLVATATTRAAMILPARFWSESMEEVWCRRLRMDLRRD